MSIWCLNRIQKNMTYYQTPFGSLLVGSILLGISHKEDNLNIHTKINYALEG